jgi:high-affinity iron transporter
VGEGGPGLPVGYTGAVVLKTIRNYSWPALGLGVLLSVALPTVVPLVARAATQPPTADAQAAQLGAILDYVVADYHTAVGDQGVLDAEELKEQQGFLAEALELAAELPAAEHSEIAALVTPALSAARRAAEPSQVVPAVRQALEKLRSHHAVQRAPRIPPSLARGKSLFEVGCVACHAADGSGHSDIAGKLSTRPPDFRDPVQAGPLSPFRVFNAVAYGVPGTAMPSFQESWGDAERWDLAFYVLALAHPGPTAGAAAPPTTLAHLAATSDDALRAELRALGVPAADVEPDLTSWRRETSYKVAVPDALSACRRTVGEAVRQYAAGQTSQARGTAISAYLDEFEAHEAGLRVRDSSLVLELEQAFADLRSGIEARLPPSEIESRGARIEALLEKAEELESKGGGGVSFAAALAIALREGLEATLLLGALLALASQSGRDGARRSVHLGWMAALVAGAATWWLSGELLAHGGRQRETMEGVVELITAALLLGGSHWLLAQAAAKRWMGFLSRHAKAVGAGAIGLGGLAFLSIYREAFEVVVFYRGLLLESPGRGRAVLAGALAGLGVLTVVVAVFQKLGRRLRPRPLLLTCGALLCGLSVVMVGEGIRALQEAGLVGLHTLELPQLPSLGVFATAEGLLAQGFVLAALLASVVYSGRGNKRAQVASAR